MSGIDSLLRTPLLLTLVKLFKVLLLNLNGVLFPSFTGNRFFSNSYSDSKLLVEIIG